MRKIKEAILTFRIEKKLSKRRILEIYLNIAVWGEGIFGIEAASRYYYNKAANEIAPIEATRLAAVLPNPLRTPQENLNMWRIALKLYMG
ncbi:MAG: transglycosylase domain-containing protein [Thermodesulfovibrionales bacterium]|nr:transglycosylase domain-containing protein [Thermodesulfovibrionales bacterium]